MVFHCAKPKRAQFSKSEWTTDSLLLKALNNFLKFLKVARMRFFSRIFTNPDQIVFEKGTVTPYLFLYSFYFTLATSC